MTYGVDSEWMDICWTCTHCNVVLSPDSSLWTKSVAAYILSNSFIQWCKGNIAKNNPSSQCGAVVSPVQNTGTHSILPGGLQHEASSIGWRSIVYVDQLYFLQTH